MYLAIDIGGTKTLIALIDDRRSIRNSIRFPSNHDQARFFEELNQNIRTNFSLDNLKAIVVAIPGPVENNRPVWFANLPWDDLDFAPKLKKLSNAPIFFENDANLAGLAEAENLPGKSIYLTFSTGIGGSIIIDGKIDSENPNFEPGHEKYEFKGETIEWEDFASAKAVSEAFGKYTHDITKKTDWVQISCRIAAGLRSIVYNHSPDQIIFGGPLGLELKKYQKPLEKQLSVCLPDCISVPKFSTAKYKHESVLYGCYLYAKSKER